MTKCCGFLDFSSQSLPIAGPQRKQPAVSVQGPGLDWTAITLKPASASCVTARRPQAQPCAQKQSTTRQQRAPTLVSATMFCKSAVSSSADPLFPGTYDCEESVRGAPGRTCFWKNSSRCARPLPRATALGPRARPGEPGTTRHPVAAGKQPGGLVFPRGARCPDVQKSAVQRWQLPASPQHGLPCPLDQYRRPISI